MKHKDIITIKPKKRGGKPCIRGMRITVYDVLEYLAAGMSEVEILEEFPYLTHDDVLACLVYRNDGENTPPEIEKIQFELMLKMTPDERIALGCEMFMSARELFLASLPKDLSDEEIKKRLYFRTYGEHLPDDFFDPKSVIAETRTK